MPEMTLDLAGTSCSDRRGSSRMRYTEADPRLRRFSRRLRMYVRGYQLYSAEEHVQMELTRSLPVLVSFLIWHSAASTSSFLS